MYKNVLELKELISGRCARDGSCVLKQRLHLIAMSRWTCAQICKSTCAETVTAMLNHIYNNHTPINRDDRKLVLDAGVSYILQHKALILFQTGDYGTFLLSLFNRQKDGAMEVIRKIKSERITSSLADCMIMYMIFMYEHHLDSSTTV